MDNIENLKLEKRITFFSREQQSFQAEKRNDQKALWWEFYISNGGKKKKKLFYMEAVELYCTILLPFVLLALFLLEVMFFIPFYLCRYLHLCL